MGRLKAPRSGLAVLDTRAAAPPKKRAAAFYQTSEWRTFIAALIRKRGRRCQKCGRPGCRVYGDHIVELSDGGAELDEANVELLCGSCHTAKSAAARAARHAAPLEG